jgi:hypothetical protein
LDKFRKRGQKDEEERNAVFPITPLEKASSFGASIRIRRNSRAGGW